MMPTSPMPPVESPVETPAASASGNARPRWPIALLLGAALVVLVGWTYAPVAQHAYVSFDDPEYVAQNPMVQGGLSWAGVKWAFAATYFSYWHPLTWLSHMLDTQLFGPGPRGPHLVNVGIHIVNTLLVLGLLRSLTGAVWRSAIVAGCFALHPLHVESVAWVSERKDVLSGFFFLLTLWAYARHVRARSEPAGDAALRSGSPLRSRWYVTALFLFACGLMSKPMVVTLPCVLLLLDYWPLRRASLESTRSAGRSLGRLAWEKWPFFVLSGGAALITLYAQRQNDVIQSLGAFSFFARLENAIVAYGLYLTKTVWPAQLAFFYPHPGDWPAPTVAVSAAGITAIAVLAFKLRREAPFVAVGWLWFLGMLVPTIGLVQVGGQALADRYTYLPHLGLFVAGVWGAGLLWARWEETRGWLAAAALFAIVGGALHSRDHVRHWRDSEALFRHALAVTENNFVAHNNLGNLLVSTGRVEEGIEHYRRALAIRADDDHAAMNLGTALLRQGLTDDAIIQFRRAVEINPNLVVAHYALSGVLLDANRAPEAIPHLQRIVAANPENGQAQLDLGRALMQQGDPAAGLVHLQRGAERLDTADAHYEAGAALYQNGEFAAAIRHLERVAEREPNDPEVHNNLGSALLLAGRATEARDRFERVLALQPGALVARQNLAIALVRMGAAAGAVPHYQAVLAAEPDRTSALTEFAWLRSTWPDAAVRDGAEAVRLAERAVALTQRNDAFAWRALAAALEESGRLAEAAEAASTAITLAAPAGDTVLRDALRAQLETYRAGRAFRDPIALAAKGEGNQL